MRLHDLLDAPEIAGQIVEIRGDRNVEVRSIEHDSRRVETGALFCCIPGDHADGHDFAATAVAAGASACLVERPVAVDVPQVHVGRVRVAVGPVAARFHGAPSHAVRVVGVTGTNGKTTTTYLLEAIARAAGEPIAVLGTTGARLGERELPMCHTTPEATELQALLAHVRDLGGRWAAMEVSSHALDQHRVDGTHFAAVCFTNLTHDHLDYHGTLDAYFEAKARLFRPEFASCAAVCVDTEPGRRMADRARAAGLTVRTYAIDPERGADVTARAVRLAPDHSAFTMVRDDADDVEIRIPLVGHFNVANALGAATTAGLAGFADDAVRAGLAAPVTVPGRMERIDAGQPFTVLVDYAHTPDALAAVLDAARPLAAPNGRVIVVFGCGGDRDRAKRPLMGAAAATRADRVIVTSDNPRSEAPAAIIAEIVAGVPDGAAAPVVEADRRRAIELACATAKAGDVVVVAGKGHETGQTTAGETVPFDDRVVARDALEARR